MAASETLERLHRLLNQTWAQEARAGVGLSFNEYSYLRQVDALAGAKVSKECSGGGEADGPHLTELAQALGVKRASASSMLTKLEKAGLIERFDCRHDARAQHFMVTLDGRAALKKGQAVYAGLASQLFGTLTLANLEAVDQAAQLSFDRLLTGDD